MNNIFNATDFHKQRARQIHSMYNTHEVIEDEIQKSEEVEEIEIEEDIEKSENESDFDILNSPL